MKQITTYINERLILSKTHASDEYGYIDEMPLGAKKAEEVYNVMYDRYDYMFSDVRLMKTGNIKLGRINDDYLIDGGLYNGSDFTLYIYEDEYVIRRSVPGSIGKFVKGLNSLEKTLEKFDKLLTKRGYKIPE
jgi:hypothetical protein